MQEHAPEQESHDGADDAHAASGPAAPEPVEFTGQAAVDAVLESLAALDDLPVAEHVEVFDRAHEGLRQALNDAGREPTSSEG